MRTATAPVINETILRLPEVLARVGVSERTLYRWTAAGTFPRPLQMGPSAVGWRASDVDRWIANLVNPTDAARR